MKRLIKLIAVCASMLLNFIPVHAESTTTISISFKYQQTEARSGVTLVNSFRSGSESWYYNQDGSVHYQNNLQPLQYDYELETVAMQRAAEIAVLYSGYHLRPDNSSFYTAYTLDGYTNVGENIAAGWNTFTSASEVINAWKETDKDYYGQGHRRSMLSGDYNVFAEACVKVDNKYYWVQEFGYKETPDTAVTAAQDSNQTKHINICDNYVETADADASSNTYTLDKIGSTMQAPVLNITNFEVTDAADDFIVESYTGTVNVNWTSSDSNVVAVSGNQITATGNGTATLSTTAFGRQYSVKIYVNSVAMQRLYNPNSGEHFYTSDLTERDNLIGYGWHYEGIGWYAPSTGTPVYRLYNANGGEHHYTVDIAERNMLISAGWKYEGEGWNSGGDVAVYRQYNPNAFSNNHNYTADLSENDWLIGLGWHSEGIGWYGIG